MRRMNSEIRKYIEVEITTYLSYAVSEDYARSILNNEYNEEETIMDAIIRNVMETSTWKDEGYYNGDDVRFAIGRILMDKMNIDL